MEALTLERLSEFVKLHHNEAVLYHLEVCRLVGCLETDEDFYYKIKHPYGHRHDEVYMSAVFGPILLKGVLSDCEYNFIENMLHMNGAEREPESIIRSTAT